MKLDELIKTKYGSVDKMLEETGMNISRSYIYQIIAGDKTNITIDVAKALSKALDVTIDELIGAVSYEETEEV